MAYLFRTAVEFMGYMGAAFVIYSSYVMIWGPPWPPLESIALPLSSMLTIIGTGVTSASVYFNETPSTPPEKKSILVTAPVVIFVCTVALIVLFKLGSLPPVTINGFAMLGIAGALLRIQPRPTS